MPLQHGLRRKNKLVVRKKRKPKWKAKLEAFAAVLGILVIIAGIVALGTWYEVSKWRVYQETHHTDISYWKWQFFINSDSNSGKH